MNTLFCDVAGVVWKIEAPAGATVAEGDVVLLVESMKMEIPVCAPRAATVEEILVAEGEPVREGQAVARLRT